MKIALWLVLWSGLALAQSYPTKPIRTVIPYPAGGYYDSVELVGGSSEQFDNFVKAEISKWARIVRESGASLE